MTPKMQLLNAPYVAYTAMESIDIEQLTKIFAGDCADFKAAVEAVEAAAGHGPMPLPNFGSVVRMFRQMYHSEELQKGDGIWLMERAGDDCNDTQLAACLRAVGDESSALRYWETAFRILLKKDNEGGAQYLITDSAPPKLEKAIKTMLARLSE